MSGESILRFRSNFRAALTLSPVIGVNGASASAALLWRKEMSFIFTFLLVIARLGAGAKRLATIAEHKVE